MHFGLQGQSPLWPNVREAFFDDLERLHEKSGPWNAVLFTGDLVQSGAKSEFDSLDEKVFGPLWDHLHKLGSIDPILLTVPGNHDLERPDLKKQKAALRLMLKKDGFAEIADEFWEDSNCEYREIISHSFDNYRQWAEGNVYSKGIILNPGILPGDFTTTLKVKSNNGNELRIGIAGINTTFLQLANGDYEKRLVIDSRQLHAASGEDLPAWARAHDACILMTHQSPHWLDATSINDVYPEVNRAGRFAVHLFGHMHETVLRSTSSGGGKTVRHWQGNSLFGLDKFGDPPQKDRRHGYGVGRIEFNNDGAFIRHWPRRGIKDPNGGWRFEPDHDSCTLIESESCTAPARLDQFSGNEIVVDKKRRSTRPKGGVNACLVSSVSTMEWPAQNEELREYCEAVANAHSHIKFVEVPLQKDLSPVQLDSLYVEPKLSHQEIHPDLPLFRWPETIEAVEALKENRTLIVLGDPGSGKSTLISCLAWQLCRHAPAENSAWVREFGGCVPIPMILREFKLKTDVVWEDLVAAFLGHHIGKLIPSRACLEELFKAGKAIIMLDGLDEIGNLNVRKKLRDAIQSGMALYQDCRWLLTSRIIGYDVVPFHVKLEEVSEERVAKGELVQLKRGVKTMQTEVANVLYLAPFSDDQIERFSMNWYSQHETESIVITQNSKDFVEAIAENHGTRRLARIPYLLTLMALIHHKNARLPHKRTELYERIATAYLEQIDLKRRLDHLPYSLQQKKRWLAEVAYRMQLQRSKGRDGEQSSQILATEAAVKRWLRSAMKASSAQGTKEEVEELLGYFAERSGLLLPRGEGMFAFMHLSLQEYFAACFIEPRLTASRFVLNQLPLEPTDNELRFWGNHEAWRETFVLLFEMVSQKSVEETEGFLSHLFDGRLEGGSSPKEGTAAVLLAEIASDPFVFLKVETKRKCIQSCWRWALFADNSGQFQRAYTFSNSVVRTLLRGSDGDLVKSWGMGSISKQELKNVEKLDLSGCGNISDISPLLFLPKLDTLVLRGCDGISDLTPVTKLKKLRSLNLDGCDMSSLIPCIGDLRKLVSFYLGSEIDLSLLKDFVFLEDLHMHFEEAGAADLTPLAELDKLSHLCIPALSEDFTISEGLRQNPQLIKSEGLKNIVLGYPDEMIYARKPKRFIRRKPSH